MNTVIATAQIVINQISCVAAWLAFSFSFLPRYCPATTAPPVASAAKTLIRSTMILSTKETPETAASPTFATIMLSAIPTSTDKSCSITSGINRAVRSRPLNKYPDLSTFPFPLIFISPFSRNVYYKTSVWRIQSFLPGFSISRANALSHGR